MKKYVMRSLLFVPGHNKRLLEKAATTEADVLLLDLEDSVSTVEDKLIARENIKNFVEKGLFVKHLIFPRVNDRESGMLLKDVYELTIKGVTGFMYPKAKKGEDIYFFDKLLETIEYEKKIPIGTFKIIPLIETTSAVLNVDEICKVSTRVVAIAFGCEDFLADLGGIHDIEGKSIFYARTIIAVAAKANNVIPIDTVHINVHDLEDLEKNILFAKNLGFEGMLVLHPKEIPYVHKYYTPSDDEVKEAKEILRLYRKSEREGKGVAIINGKFIGPPMVKRALKILEKSTLIKNKENNKP